MKIENILVPSDFGASSHRALSLAIDLAKKFGARITLVHGFEVPSYAYSGLGMAIVDYLSPIEDGARQALQSELRELEGLLPGSVALFRKGVPYREILAAIEETKADLVVMGTHGRQGLRHALIGSVAERIVRLSSIPVLTVREASSST
jgi:nucleotide-binding universal stress UspA family protein